MSLLFFTGFSLVGQKSVLEADLGSNDVRDAYRVYEL